MNTATAGPEIRTRRFGDRQALLAALAEMLAGALATAPGGPADSEPALTGSEPARGSEPAGAVMLSGGSTPIPAYRALATRGVRPAPGLHLLYSDDRYVPSTSAASNYHQTLELVEALQLPAAQVLRVRTELPLAEAAEDYDRRLAELASRRVPIRLGLLGLGADGHTASLFTAEDIERARGRRALAVHRPDGRDAVSVSPAVLAEVARLVFVVAGADKRTAVAALLGRDAGLTAWRAVSGCSSIEVWSDPEAWPPD